MSLLAAGAPVAGAPVAGEEALTVTADAVAEEIMKGADPNTQERIKAFVDAGMHVLFKEDSSHHAIFDAINVHDEVPIADEIGAGAVNLATQLLDEAMVTVGDPQEMDALVQALIPAGAILLAKVFEFVDQTGIAPVTDQDFADAMEMFAVALMRELSPDEGQPMEGQPMEGQPMEGQPMAAPPPTGGLLQQQGGLQ